MSDGSTVSRTKCQKRTRAGKKKNMKTCGVRKTVGISSVYYRHMLVSSCARNLAAFFLGEQNKFSRSCAREKHGVDKKTPVNTNTQIYCRQTLRRVLKLNVCGFRSLAKPNKELRIRSFSAYSFIHCFSLELCAQIVTLAFKTVSRSSALVL